MYLLWISLAFSTFALFHVLGEIWVFKKNCEDYSFFLKEPIWGILSNLGGIVSYCFFWVIYLKWSLPKGLEEGVLVSLLGFFLVLYLFLNFLIGGMKKKRYREFNKRLEAYQESLKRRGGDGFLKVAKAWPVEGDETLVLILREGGKDRIFGDLENPERN